MFDKTEKGILKYLLKKELEEFKKEEHVFDDYLLEYIEAKEYENKLKELIEKIKKAE